MIYTYHYHAVWRNADGSITNADGLADLRRRIKTHEDYLALKSAIKDDAAITNENITICSIILLSKEEG